ncbi:MAG: hypothetical protein GEU28_00095 [Dehalococcoidia bacterium]|nr:hypothetical protein [Dehalococcoidia bacterium]
MREWFWEKIDSKGAHKSVIYRARVPGGWLISMVGDGWSIASGLAITFVPDASHEWDGNSLEVK